MTIKKRVPERIEPNTVWEIIRALNPRHQDYPVTSAMLARFAQELQKDLDERRGEKKEFCTTFGSKFGKDFTLYTGSCDECRHKPAEEKDTSTSLAIDEVDVDRVYGLESREHTKETMTDIFSSLLHSHTEKLIERVLMESSPDEKGKVYLSDILSELKKTL